MTKETPEELISMLEKGVKALEALAEKDKCSINELRWVIQGHWVLSDPSSIRSRDPNSFAPVKDIPVYSFSKIVDKLKTAIHD